ncbi:HSP20-like chaperones superfamily protein [Euphorbia peplus]|nr:HSP20-like chaperones superfamily protein [Euphorbia peplus]
MEVELGLKITHTRDDIISHSNLHINKNHAGPLFLSRETDIVFFLIAYLKGFKRENIDININEDGSRITISGKRAVQEMVLSGSWIMQRKDVELRAFKKVFQIPDGIILDKIKAKFNDEQSCLTVVMPKKEKGMRGLEIQEVKEDSKMDEIEESVEKEFERIDENDHDDDNKIEGESEKENDEAKGTQNEEEKISEGDQEMRGKEEASASASGDEDKEFKEEESIEVERHKSKIVKKSRGSNKLLCPPFVVAGSAILVSLVVLVFTFIRAKRR